MSTVWKIILKCWHLWMFTFGDNKAVFIFNFSYRVNGKGEKLINIIEDEAMIKDWAN